MAFSDIPCPYTALGLDFNASPAAIRSAYKKLMLQCHPDKVHDESQAEEKAAQYEKVREAYELLSDPKRKRKYDNEMKREAACDKEPSSRSSSAHVEIPVPESRESSAEGKPREKTRDRTPRRDESRSSKRAPEPEVEEVVVEEAEPEVEEPLPKERTERDSSNSRSSKEREPIFEVEVEEIDETTEPVKPHSHSRCSSQEKKSRTESTSSQTPPTMEAKEELLRKYEEERRKEEALLLAARQKMMGFEAETPSTAPLGGHRNGSSERSHDRAAKAERSRLRREREREREQQQAAAAAAAAASGMDPAAYWEAVRLEKERRHYARQKAGVDLGDDFDQSTIHPMDDIPQPSPKMSESRRGSKQRDNSPKDTPPTSRERKSSQSGSERKESVSPVRESTHQTQRPIPIRNPYGSNAPPPAASSAFGSSFSSSTSPRRRHSVSNSADPTKARLHREDSGYSSPNYSGTPMGPNEPKLPPSFHRSATESFGKKVVEIDQDEEAAVQEFLEQRRRQKKAESSHPLDGDMPSTAPLRPKEHRKKSSSGSAPIPSPGNAVPVNPYYPAYGYYPTAAGTPMYVPAPSSAHPHGSSRRHGSHSSHHSGQSPHASPKIPADGFAGMRSPSFSGAHPGAEFYAQYDPAYYAHAHASAPLRNANTF